MFLVACNEGFFSLWNERNLFDSLGLAREILTQTYDLQEISKRDQTEISKILIERVVLDHMIVHSLSLK